MKTQATRLFQAKWIYRLVLKIARRLRSIFPRPTSVRQRFTQVYRHNGFGGAVSVSGPGSDLTQTKIISRALPALLAEFQVRSILDIPCGDFYWMRHVPLGQAVYTGADIVREIVEHNQKYARKGVSFYNLNLLKDRLPRVDLVLCRDCLVHFSIADVFRALRNIHASGSPLLLTTTFTADRNNIPIKTGQWRPVNLERTPFLLPPPLRIINEGCTEVEGQFADKSLGLWRTADLKQALTIRRRFRSLF